MSLGLQKVCCGISLSEPSGDSSGEDYIISFDVTLKAGMDRNGRGRWAAHRACDRFIQIFREQLKKMKGNLCTERQ